MIQELLYTSAPKGLKPGSRGFCTVVSSAGMAAPVAMTLEGLSGYRPVYPPDDPRVRQNPVVWSHLLMSLGGKRSSILSRVSDYGLDYSQRTNKLAHHVVLDASDRPPAGPAWLVSQPDWMRAHWDGELAIVPAGRQVPRGEQPPAVCTAWKQATGDAGWAGVLAESFLKAPDRPAYLIFAPGMDMLALIGEALALLPPERRWEVTFSTYFTKIPNGATCNWRCVLADSPEANESRRFVQSLRLNLCEPLGPATGGELVEASRTGRLRARPAEAPAALPVSPIPPPPGVGELRIDRQREQPRRDVPDRVQPPSVMPRPPAKASSAKKFIVVWTACLLLLSAGGAGWYLTHRPGRTGGQPVPIALEKQVASTPEKGTDIRKPSVESGSQAAVKVTESPVKVPEKEPSPPAIEQKDASEMVATAESSEPSAPEKPAAVAAENSASAAPEKPEPPAPEMPAAPADENPKSETVATKEAVAANNARDKWLADVEYWDIAKTTIYTLANGFGKFTGGPEVIATLWLPADMCGSDKFRSSGSRFDRNDLGDWKEVMRVNLESFAEESLQSLKLTAVKKSEGISLRSMSRGVLQLSTVGGGNKYVLLHSRPVVSRSDSARRILSLVMDATYPDQEKMCRLRVDQMRLNILGKDCNVAIPHGHVATGEAGAVSIKLRIPAIEVAGELVNKYQGIFGESAADAANGAFVVLEVVVGRIDVDGVAAISVAVNVLEESLQNWLVKVGNGFSKAVDSDSTASSRQLKKMGDVDMCSGGYKVICDGNISAINSAIEGYKNVVMSQKLSAEEKKVNAEKQGKLTTLKEQIESLKGFDREASELLEKCRSATVESLVISQEATNDNETKFVPLVVYRRAEEQATGAGQ
ncbi:hypothetical protein [Planctomicrobium sp. SH664]|uniref:GAP1-N2 domain-containing protein n=1 Tax=Planctomicrobium sp. SH664 TaxID=3448125 RepID=UPI003F5B0CB3